MVAAGTSDNKIVGPLDELTNTIEEQKGTHENSTGKQCA